MEILTCGLVLPAVPVLHDLLDPDFQQLDLSSRLDGLRLYTK